MRVLFLMSHAGATRNFESTLRGLAGRCHEVHLAFDRMEKKNLPGLWDLANALVAEYPGITTGEHPQPEGDWSLISGKLRTSLDYMRYFDTEFKDAPKLRRRAERWVPPRAERMVARFPARGLLRGAVRRAERSAPVSEAVERYLREQEPDVVLVTPLLEPGSVQTEYVRAANRMGIPTCLCVHSWDNLTNKGVIHELPDAVVVWNEAQRDEAVRLHGVPPERVAVTGATPYDHWYEWKPSRSREEFAAAVGLDPSRPFVAYLGSSGFIAPDEAAFVVEWVRELERHGLDDLQVLVRPHPVNPLVGDSPAQAELASLGNAKLYPPAGANPTGAESRRDYFDTFYYCHAASGINTTAFLEAAILGRPVLTVTASGHEETQAGMLHFHHLLTAGGGLLQVAQGWEEHARQLSEALAAEHPDGCVSERSLRFTEAFIRPHGLDKPATPFLVETVEGLEKQRGGTPGPSMTGTLLARIVRSGLMRARRRARRRKAAEARAGAQPAPSKPKSRRGRSREKARSAVRKAERHRSRTEKARRAEEKLERARAKAAKADPTQPPATEH